MGYITSKPASGGGGGPSTGGVLVTAALAAGANNDFNPGGAFPVGVGRLDLDSTAGVATVTGLLAGSDGQQVFIRNKPGGNNVTLMNANGGSAAANQFTSSDDIILTPGTAVVLMYTAGAINKWALAP
ncbi:MAG TPA: hypothetical protein VET48_04845 [Steroidobacteraceae bacterium]|nr:hypothetical protein [Steroidobacteraceae bacterium]